MRISSSDKTVQLSLVTTTIFHHVTSRVYHFFFFEFIFRKGILFMPFGHATQLFGS